MNYENTNEKIKIEFILKSNHECNFRPIKVELSSNPRLIKVGVESP